MGVHTLDEGGLPGGAGSPFMLMMWVCCVLSVGRGWRGDGGWGRDGGIGWGGQRGMQGMCDALAVRWVLTGALSAVMGRRGGAPWWGPGAR